MNRFLYTLLAFGLISLAGYASDNIPPTQKNALNLRHGVNMSYWVAQRSLWPESGKTDFGFNELSNVASLGFDHIRLPIDEHILFDENLNKRGYTFEETHKIIRWCLELKLNVIIDLHTIKSHIFDGPEASNPLFKNKEDQERLYRMWELLSEEFHDYPLDKVAYEILNEPATVIGIDGADKAESTAKWDYIQRNCYNIIREREPERIILLAPDQWQAYHMVKWMWLPENDPNIMIAMHYYEPMQITHYNIRWSGVGKYRGKIHYPGQVITEDDLASRPKAEQEYCANWPKCVYNRERISREIDEAYRVAVKRGIPLYCSEFGVTSNVQSPDREAWFDDVTLEMEKRGIGHASWEYKGTWGIISDKTGKVNCFMLPDPDIVLK